MFIVSVDNIVLKPNSAHIINEQKKPYKEHWYLHNFIDLFGRLFSGYFKVDTLE